ncbi:MAG: CPBP family intramembrane metalloprotease [Bacillota bacterium]|nr:CPBP family intramembrane metalloprotease [Bacillota bacterium]
MQNLDKRNIVLFVAVVYVLTYALNFYIYLQGGFVSQIAIIIVPLQMLIPALVAAALILKERGKFRDYGFSFGKIRFYLLAYFLFVGYHLVHSLVSAAIGLGEFVPLAEGFSRIAPGMQWSVWQIVLVVFILGPVQNIVFGFGEEFGWRGYLVNKLLPWGLWNTILVSGIIWGLWHAPLILMEHNFPENPYLGILIMTLATISLGAVLIWLRLKTGSAVVVGFAHGVLNGTLFLGGAFVPTASMLWVNPIGLIGLPLLTLLAYSLFRFFPVRVNINA